MRKFFCFIWLVCLTFSVGAQEVLSLDSCRALAIANNKELLISQEKINSAHYQRKAAFTNYLPDISATGGYMRTQKEISILSDAQKGALGSMGTQVSGAMQNGIQGILTQHPELTQNPQFMALIQALGSVDIASPLNGLGNSLVDAFRTDTRNMYAGALTLTQPLYMGGKIRAYNKITKYAEELVKKMNKVGAKAYLVNTGWNGSGKRISIKDTRGIIDAILDGSIDKAPTKVIPYFDFVVPTELPGVDPKILDPRDTYECACQWEEKAKDLAGRFIKNFAKFTGNEAGKALVAAGPKL